MGSSTSFLWPLVTLLILLLTTHLLCFISYLSFSFTLHIISFIWCIHVIKQLWWGGIWEHHEMKAAFVELSHFHGVYWLISGCVAVKAGTRIHSMWCTTPAEHRALTILQPSFLFASQLLLQEMCCWFNDVAVFLGVLFWSKCCSSKLKTNVRFIFRCSLFYVCERFNNSFVAILWYKVWLAA